MIALLLGIFARAYGNVSDDHITSAIVAPDDGFVLTGGTWSWGSGQSDMFIVKTNPYGAGIWTAVYGGSGTDEAAAIIATTDAGYAIAGLTSSYGAGSADMLVLKLTSTGVITWARVIGGTGVDEAYGIAQVTDGGYVVTGRSWVSGEGYNLLVFRLNTDGTIGWGGNIRTFGGTVDDYGYWVAPTADGGAVVTGGTRSYGAGQDDAVVLLFNSSGLRTWFRVLGGSGIDIGQCVIQTPDEGFVVAGRTNSWGAGGYDFLVFKLDSDGNTLWARTIGGANNDYAYSVIQTQDDGFLVAGETWSYGLNNEAMVVKLNSSGGLTWARLFGGPEGGANDYDYARAAMKTGEGYLAFAGTTSSFGLESGLYAFLLKMTSYGEYPGCVRDCSPSLTNPTLSSVLPTLYANTTRTTSSPSVNSSFVEPNQDNLCPPVGRDESQGPRGPVICMGVPGGLVFAAGAETGLSIYSADGKLVHSLLLEKGKTRISLDRGVYLWLTRNQKGKAVVR